MRAFFGNPRLIGVAFAMAMAMPLGAVSALKHQVAKNAAQLPALEHSALVLDRAGALLRPFPIADGRWRIETGIGDVDPDYIAMLLAYEDKRFHNHRGVDVSALIRSALMSARHGRTVSGGSTLTMQVARLIEGHRTRTLSAKAAQMLQALALEKRYDKAEILTHYLNRAPFGGNLEGVRTASLAYFGKEPLRLSAAEAALLVALPQSPEARRPDRSAGALEAVMKARNRVLRRALETGLVDERQYRRALNEKVPAVRRPMPVHAAHLADRLVAEKPDQSVHNLTLDGGLQARLEALAGQRAKRLGSAISVAILVADHRSGEIRASVGSADYFDRSRLGFVDMTQAVRSPGSTLKPLIYGLAFQDGTAHPESLIEDRPMAFNGYRPANFDREYLGTVTIRKALQLSLNVPAVQMLEEVGPARLLAAMRRAGAVPVMAERSTANLAIGLGGIGMRLTDIVALQAMIASGGRAVPLHYDLSEDHTLTARARAQVLDPRAAWQVASILAGVQDPHGMTPGDIAFKTGTSYGYRDAWAVGFDGRHAVGVWVGRADGKPVSGLAGGLVGIEIAAPILGEVFSRIGEHHRLPPAPPGTRIASTGALPSALRRVGALAERAQAQVNAPEITFPPDRARIELGREGEALLLEVQRGELPLTVLINGAPVETDPWRRTLDWVPDGAGQVDILVIDAKGAAARSSVFLR
jgi:penicillin-binding protein 1C